MVEVKETTKKRTRRSAGAKAKAAKKVPRGGDEGHKQSYIKGMEPKRIKSIEDKGGELIEAIDQRKIWLVKAQGAREALIDIMMKEGVDEYMLEVDSRKFKLELSKETKVSAKKLKIMPDES